MHKDFIKIITHIQNEEDMDQFFNEIFTPNELKDIALRWQLLCELYKGKTQRRIASEYHMSLCKITRGSKILKNKNSRTHHILKHHFGEKYHDTTIQHNGIT